MKSLITNLALVAGLALPMAAGTLLAAPAHADEGVVVERTVVHRNGPNYHHRYRSVRQTHCWWHHHHHICRSRWVRVYR